MRDRRYGGGQTFSFGPGRIDEPNDSPKPDFQLGQQTTHQVRQLTAGIGHEGRWRDVGELSIGIPRTFYETSTLRPSGPLPVSEASSWLFNGTLSIHASSDLAFYAGYTRGLRRTRSPEIAVNRGEAPPAIVTEQMDAGFRFNLTRTLRLVGGVFEVRKPYFALDLGFLFRELGVVRNRGMRYRWPDRLCLSSVRIAITASRDFVPFPSKYQHRHPAIGNCIL